MNKSWTPWADADTTCEGKMTKDHDSNRHANNPVTGVEDKAQIRRWLDDKMRRWAGRGLAGGLGSTLMALPALGQATIEELYAFQFAETIPGVRSVKLLKDGDVLVKLANGKSMIVASENIQILDSGAIMIAEDIVAEIAQFSLAAEAGGAAAASGIGGVGAAALGGLGLAGAAAAAGGGGGGGGDDPAPAPTYPHLNLAGAQSNALSSTALNSVTPDGTTDIEVSIGSVSVSVVPEPDGSWNVALTPDQAANLPQGVNTVTIRHLDGEGNELAVENVTFNVDTIAPTLAITDFSHGAVVNAIEQGNDLTVSGTSDAENGQTITVSVNGQVYSATVNAGLWTATIPAADLSALPDGTTISVTADVTDAAGNPAPQATGSFETDFTAPTLTLNPVAGGSIDLIDVGSDLNITGTTTAADGEIVSLDFNGQVYTGTASGGNWTVTIPAADLSGLSTGTPVAIGVSVADAAGNISTLVNASFPVDLTGPSISIATLPVGDALNTAEVTSDLTISGTTANVQDGQTVTVTLDGQTYTGTVTSGVWNVTIPASDLGALTDGGTFSITADVSDTDGLIAPQATTAIVKDVTAPTLSIDSFSAGAVMNASERGTDLTITGTTNAEDGQTVTVNLGGQSYTATVSGGAWTATAPASDVAALSDGATIAVTADVSDEAGNPAVRATSSFDTDFSAPSINVTSLSDGPVLNFAELSTNLMVSGTSDAGDGAVVSVQIVRGDGTVDVAGTATVNSGSWSFTATPSDLTALQDTESYTVSASVSDTAGNTASDISTFDTDFSAPVIAIDPLAVGSTLDIAERGSDLTVSGTTTAEDGQTVTVSLNGQDYVATIASGSWSATIPSGDLGSLADTTAFTISANVADLAGNPATPATAAITTDFRPILSLNSTGTNGSVLLADAQSTGLTVSGSSIGLTAGQTVSVTLNGTPVGTASVGADGTWSLPVSSSDFAGLNAGDDLTFQVQATVTGGPDPAPTTDTTTAYLPAAYTISEVSNDGSSVIFQIHADPNRDISGGLAVTAEIGFDPAVVTINPTSISENSDFGLFLTNPVGASAVNIAGVATTYSDLSQPVVTFTAAVVDPSKPIILTIDTPDGGPSVYQLGSGGDDTLTANAVDNFLQGFGGNDTIDVSNAGRDVVVFEATPAANGVDTITGFTLGAKAEVTDAIMFNGFDSTTLRGDGTNFETLELGDAVGTNTGFVGLTTVLVDLSAGTIENAVESLSDLQAGDEIYVMATDGDDSVLVHVEYSAPNAASVETVAEFTGLDDLSGLSPDNILHTDPTGASA